MQPHALPTRHPADLTHCQDSDTAGINSRPDWRDHHGGELEVTAVSRDHPRANDLPRKGLRWVKQGFAGANGPTQSPSGRMGQRPMGDCLPRAAWTDPACLPQERVMGFEPTTTTLATWYSTTELHPRTLGSDYIVLAEACKCNALLRPEPPGKRLFPPDSPRPSPTAPRSAKPQFPNLVP